MAQKGNEAIIMIKEADLKLAVEDYLTYLMNQGKLYFDRLNSGEVIVVAGKSRRRIKLCREGTADFFVLYSGKPITLEYANNNPRVILLELKSEKGKQRAEQGAFQKVVEAQGAEYHIIRSIEELENVLEVNK